MKRISKSLGVWFSLILILLLTGCSTAEPDIGDRTVITIGCLVERDVSEFVERFNETQDDIYLKIESYYDESDSISYEASREQMYASITTGTAPDMIYMLRLDEAALRNAGLLLDVAPLIETDEAFCAETYQTHVWDLFKHGDSLYQIAASFHLYGIEAPKEVLGDRHGWTLEEFESFINANPNSLYIEQQNMLECMLRYGVQGDFVDLQAGKCSFETQEFFELLEFLKKCPVIASNAGARIGGYFQSVDRYSRTVKSDGVSLRYAGFPSKEKTGPVAMITDSFGISTSTKEQSACWIFIKWMLSYETQEYLYSEDPYEIPIRVDVLNETMRRAQLSSDQEDSLFYGETAGAEKRGDKWVSIPFSGVPKEDVSYLNTMIQDVDRAAFSNGDITKIVEEEILAYLAGDKTAEECAHLIQSRVSILLAEMQ